MHFRNSTVSDLRLGGLSRHPTCSRCRLPEDGIPEQFPVLPGTLFPYSNFLGSAPPLPGQAFRPISWEALKKLCRRIRTNSTKDLDDVGYARFFEEILNEFRDIERWNGGSETEIPPVSCAGHS